MTRRPVGDPFRDHCSHQRHRGSTFYVSVTAKNSAGTTMIGYSGSVMLTSSDGQSLRLTAPLIFSMGMAQAAVTLDTADTVTLDGHARTSRARAHRSSTARACFPRSPSMTGYHNNGRAIPGHDHGRGRLLGTPCPTTSAGWH